MSARLPGDIDCLILAQTSLIPTTDFVHAVVYMGAPCLTWVSKQTESAVSPASASYDARLCGIAHAC